MYETIDIAIIICKRMNQSLRPPFICRRQCSDVSQLTAAALAFATAMTQVRLLWTTKEQVF
ncbi:MAG: hypothetical protein K6F64_08270 [Clostridia bacterium]|nr:hypothetical protein [Clostridia bacterium]